MDERKNSIIEDSDIQIIPKAPPWNVTLTRGNISVNVTKGDKIGKLISQVRMVDSFILGSVASHVNSLIGFNLCNKPNQL